MNDHAQLLAARVVPRELSALPPQKFVMFNHDPKLLRPGLSRFATKTPVACSRLNFGHSERNCPRDRLSKRIVRDRIAC
jgi:hypothetical protein